MLRLDSIGDLVRFDTPLHLAIGVFDGVHIGHQAVLQAARQGALAEAGRSVMVTFDPHPVRVLRPAEAPRILTHTRHKLQLVSDLGIDAALVIRFDSTFSIRPARDFIFDLTSAAPTLRRICVGHDWRFGARRGGDLALLQSLGADLGFEAVGVPPVTLHGVPVSSTRIRALVREGNFDAVVELLGRPYTVLGEVLSGRRLGRTIGIPTANLAVFDEQLPPGGVYAVRARRHETTYDAVANLGIRPTVEGSHGQRLLEVHLLDYDGDEFYGEDLEVTFVRFLRPEMTFESLDALRLQIDADIRLTRDILAG